MRENYKLVGPTAAMNINVEKEVAETIQAMEAYSKIPSAELVNTAVKRFISSHKDFLPPDYKKTKAGQQ